MKQQFIITTPEQLEEIVSKCVNTEMQKFISEIEKGEDEYLTVNQVAKLFGVSKVTIHTWKRKGILPFHYINSRVRFSKQEMIKLLKTKRKYGKHL